MKKSTQDPDRNTITQSLSFNNVQVAVSFAREVYAMLEKQRTVVGKAEQGKPMERSHYVAAVLVEKWKHDKLWPPVRDVLPFVEQCRTADGIAYVGRPMPRSEYIGRALVEKWKRDGVWPHR